MGLLNVQPAKEPPHPQTKSLPWIPTCKMGQPSSFHSAFDVRWLGSRGYV
jgi:hypothetical protein